MWKVFFNYSDGSKLTLTGKGKEIPPRLVRECASTHAKWCESAVYQQYPKKDHEPQDFLAMARKEMGVN